MAILEWDKKYEVGNSRMDEQHKRIFNLINEIYDSFQDGNTKEIISKTMDTLYHYIKEHFKDEEELMKQNDFPGLNDQIEQHNKFTDKVCEYNKSFIEKENIAMVNVFNFLGDWWNGHILDMDNKYKGHV